MWNVLFIPIYERMIDMLRQGTCGTAQYSIMEEPVLNISFPDGKEYIFYLLTDPSISEINEVCKRGDGRILYLPQDQEQVIEAVRESSRLYVFHNEPSIFDCFLNRED